MLIWEPKYPPESRGAAGPCAVNVRLETHVEGKRTTGMDGFDRVKKKNSRAESPARRSTHSSSVSAVAISLPVLRPTARRHFLLSSAPPCDYEAASPSPSTSHHESPSPNQHLPPCAIPIARRTSPESAVAFVAELVFLFRGAEAAGLGSRI
jgi:hypothetical protein